MRLIPKVIVLALVMALIPCSAACAEKKIDTEPPVEIIDHNLSIHEFGGDVLQSKATIDGKAKNTSNLTIGSATINVNFYDKDGNLLQTASTTKQNWETGEIWYFTVQFISTEAWKTVRYDISVSTNE